MWQKLGLSMLGSLISQSFNLVVSYTLDKRMNNKTSNLIGVLAGFCLNFLLQYNVFMTPHLKVSKTVIKYLLSEILIIGSIQLGVSVMLDNKTTYKTSLPPSLRKYYNTIARIFVAIVVALFLSYPIRNLWVFV